MNKNENERIKDIKTKQAFESRKAQDM